MAAATVITLKRGDQYVEDRESGELAHGLVGELWVHGLCFDAIERMDGFVALDGGRDYPWSSMYWHKRLGCYVVNPWHKKKNKDGEHAQILVHKAAVPSHLQGCIAPGVFDGTKLTLSREAMEVIWDQCGGKPSFTEKNPLVVTLRVEGNMRSLAHCRPYAG